MTINRKSCKAFWSLIAGGSGGAVAVCALIWSAEMELRKWLGRETKTRAAGYGQGVADYDARHLRHYFG